MAEESQERRGSFPGAVARGASGLVVLAGCLALAGWLFDMETLKSVLPGRIAMNPVTAVCFILGGTGGALWAVAPPEAGPGGGAARLAAVCGGIIAGVAVLRLGGYLFGWDTGVDQLLFRSKLDVGGAFPNRMAPNTAFNFLLVGLGLAFFDRETRGGFRPAQSLALAAALIALLALTGYFYSVVAFYGAPSTIPMA